MPGSSGDGTADSAQPCRQLQAAAKREKGNADHPTGLRRGELLALLWTDLNIKEKCLTVSKSVARGKGELRVTEPKTKNSVRTVYVDDETIRLLLENRKNHPFGPYLFPSPVTGGMYGPDCVGRIHKKLLKQAGIEEHVRFHDLRRTFATMALQNAGTLLGGVHAGRLYQRDKGDAEGCRKENRRLHGGGHVNPSAGGQKSTLRRSFVLSRPFRPFPRVGQGVGLTIF